MVAVAPDLLSWTADNPKWVRKKLAISLVVNELGTAELSMGMALSDYSHPKCIT